MIRELPKGWAQTTLGDLCDYVSSGSRDWSQYYSDHGALFVRTQDINQNRLAPIADIAQVALPKQVEGKRTLIKQGDLLITITGANVGKCAYVQSQLPEAYVSQSVALTRLKSGLCGQFIQQQLITCSETGRSLLQDSAYGVGRPVLNLSNVRETPILLAPLLEQQRLSDKVVLLLDKVDTSRARLRSILQILKRFRQSVLAAACSGRLTADWREERNEDASTSELFAEIQNTRQLRFANEVVKAKSHGRRARWSKPELLPEPTEEELTDSLQLPDEWLYCRLGNLAEIVRGASPRPAGDPRYFGGNIPWITVAELTKDEAVHLDAVSHFVTKEGKERSRFIEAGTLLLTNSGATLGVPKVTRIGGCINDGSVALVDIPLTSQLFLYYFLKSQTQLLRSINQGAAQPNLNTEIVKNIITPLPPLAEQTEIVRRVESLFLLADRIETRFAEGRKRIDTIADAILAKAFRGELVPTEAELASREGRSYESASELLDRIRASAAHSNNGASSKPRKTRAK
jgi:type I restriction enzyme S subunit